MADKAYKVRGVVKKVISVGPGGGAIIALHRARLDTVRVVISHDMIGERPYAGEVLLVQGHYQVHPVYDEQLHATAVHAACPTIHELAGLIGRHPSFAYMSVRRARHLVSSDGQAFLDALENGDLEYLMDARFELQNAVALIQQWKRYWARKRTAELLVKGGIAPTFANELLRLYGYDADRRIRQDPFKLVPFCTWTAVDEFSRKVSDTANSSNRRLIAAAEMVLMETEKSGRLAATRQHVISRLSRYIGPSLSEGAIDAAVSAGRLVEWKSPNNTVIQSVGVSIVLRNLSQRLDDYAKSAQNVGPATGGRHAKNQVCAPIELLALPCSTALAVANRANPTERPLHIVPTLTERDAINATGRGRAITFAETLTRLPHPKRKSYRTLFVHNCDGLDLLTLSKVLQRLPMGGWLRLCFSLAISPGQLRILQTITSERLTSALKATNLKLSEQLCGTSDDMTRVSEALRHGSPIALDRVEPGCTISGGAAFMRCSDRLAVPNETKAAFYASNFRGKTAIVAPTAIQCAQFNIDLHNDRVDYLRASDQQNPFIRLRNHESATVGEPVVCRSNLHRLNLTSGSIGKIVAIFDKPRIAVIEGTVVELSVLIDFESIGKTLVSMEELKTLSLAYALPLSRARFSEWEHIVVPITRSKAVDNTWIRQTSGIATRSILFIGTDNNCMRTSEGCHAFTEGLYV